MPYSATSTCTSSWLGQGTVVGDSSDDGAVGKQGRTELLDDKPFARDTGNVIEFPRHSWNSARSHTFVCGLAIALGSLLAGTARADSRAETSDPPAMPALPPSSLLMQKAPRQAPPLGVPPANPTLLGNPRGMAAPPRGQQPPIIVDDPFPPRLLNNVPPLYPPQARREGQQGTVLLRLEVMEHGAVSRVELLSSSGHELLDSAAIAAVQGWRYAPVRQGGKPIRWAGRLPVNFVLD